MELADYAERADLKLLKERITDNFISDSRNSNIRQNAPDYSTMLQCEN